MGRLLEGNGVPMTEPSTEPTGDVQDAVDRAEAIDEPEGHERPEASSTGGDLP
jgi:hypothetical protein